MTRWYVVLDVAFDATDEDDAKRKVTTIELALLGMAPLVHSVDHGDYAEAE